MEEENSQMNSGARRIAKNTVMLYFRQIIILLIGLYTVRVILNTLGVEDYGVYNVVAGVVTMFSFLSSSMATASQRYLSYAIGKNDDELLNKTFSVTFTVYVILAFGVLLLAETIGMWYVKTQLIIPNGRMVAALWVYQLAIVSFTITMLTTPYMSSIIAHENMSIYAYVSIVEATLKLVIVFLLRILPYDKLIVYSALLLIVLLINTSLYRAYCHKKYFECKVKLLWDGQLFKESFSFTGWTLFGSFTSVLRTQALTIMINQVFGIFAVTARTIAMNVANYVNIFSNNFNTGLYPSIIKEYAGGFKHKMYALVINGSKLTFFLMWIFALPMYVHMDFVLKIWLGTSVDGAVLFTRLALIESLINSVTLPVATAARAPGKMKAYESILGSLQIMIFLVSLILVNLGGKVETVYYVAIIINIVMLYVRLLLVKKLIGLPVQMFSKYVLLPIGGMILISVLPTWFTYIILPKTFLLRCLNVAVSVLVSTTYMYFFGIDLTIRNNIKEFIRKKLYH